MQKRHYEAIAAAVREARTYGVAPGAAGMADTVADCLADKLAQFNPNFDRVRFLRACGVES